MYFSKLESATILALLAPVSLAQSSASTVKASSNVGASTSDKYPPASSKSSRNRCSIN